MVFLWTLCIEIIYQTEYRERKRAEKEATDTYNPIRIIHWARYVQRVMHFDWEKLPLSIYTEKLSLLASFFMLNLIVRYSRISVRLPVAIFPFEGSRDWFSFPGFCGKVCAFNEGPQMVDELVAEGMLNSRGKEDMDHSGCTPVLFTLQCVQDGCRAWSVAQWGTE
jgi:hypothetical protein